MAAVRTVAASACRGITRARWEAVASGSAGFGECDGWGTTKRGLYLACGIAAAPEVV